MKTKREELISLLNFLGKSKDQIDKTLKTFDSEQGKINDPAKDANVGSNNTASDSVNGLSDSQNFDYLNYKQNDGSVSIKPFFDQSEEQAIAQLRARYPGFKFEETNTFKLGFNVIKASFETPKGVVSKNIEFNIGQSVEKDEALDAKYKKSYDDLTSFIKKYSTGETNLKAAKAREERIKAYKRLNDNTQPTTDEIKDVTNKYNKEDLFNPLKENIVSYGGMDSKYVPSSLRKTKVTNPYEQEIKEARTRLQQQGIKDDLITDKAVKDLARQILIDKDLAKIKSKKTENILDKLEDYNLETYQYEIKLAAKEFASDYNARSLELSTGIMELEESDLSDDIMSEYEKLEDENYQYSIKPGDTTIRLENGKLVPASIIQKYNSNLKNFNSKKNKLIELNNSLVEDSDYIKDVGQQMDLLRRNYNGLEEFAVETALGLFVELPAAVAYGGNRFLGQTDDYTNKAYIDLKNKINTIRDSYKKDVEFKDAFSSISNFGSFAAQELSNQIPIFASLAIPGGTALIGAQAFGDQYSEMVREENKIDGKKSSQAKKWFSSLGFAASEVVFESLTTLPLIRNAKKAFLNNPSKNQMFVDGFKRYFKNNATRSLVYQPLGESVSEGMTTISQNLISGKPLTQDIDHAMFSGLMFGTTLSTTPFLKGAYVSTFSDYDTKQKVRNNIKLMQRLETTNNKIKKSIDAYGKSRIGNIEDVKANEAKIKELQQANESEYKKIEDKVKSLTPTAAKLFFESSNRLEEIRIEAARIENSNMPQDVKESRLADLKFEFDATQASINEFKNSETFNNNWSLFKGDNKNLSEVNRITNLAKFNLEANNKNKENITQELIEEEARIIYNKEVINKDIAKKRGNNKLRSSLVSHETVNETIDYLKKDAEAKISKLDDSLTPEQNKKAVKKIQSQLADNIKTFKKGAHGAMQVDANGNKVALVNVNNMAKDDRLETRTHELSHIIFTDALGVEQESYRGLSDQILSWTKENQNESFKRILLNTERDANNQLLPAEVVSVFLEEVAAGKINLNKKSNSNFAGLLGHLINQGTKEAVDIEIDLAGETDAIKFLVGLGQRIKKGDLNTKEIKKIKKGRVLGRFQKSLVKDDIPTMFSKEASDKVQKTYDDLGEAGAMDIIKEFKPIVIKQARRFRDVPGYSEADIISEIEIGKRGIFDLIREYKPDSGVPLAAYINKFLPVRANEAAGRILGEQFTEDVTEAKAVTATETAEDIVAEAPKLKRKGIILSERLNVKEKIKPKVEEYISKNNLQGLSYKQTPNLSTEAVGELMGISPIKITNNANITKKELASAQMFINKNSDMLLSMLPEGFTSEGQATGVQKVLLEGLYNKKSVRAKTKAGLNVQVKRPNITRAEFLEKFGIVDGKRFKDDRNTSSRVLALAKQLDRAISNQSIREALMEKNNVTGVIQTLQDGKSNVMFSRSVDSNTNQEVRDFFYAFRPDFWEAIESGGNWDIKGIRRAFDKIYMFDNNGNKINIINKELRKSIIRDYANMLSSVSKVKEDFDSTGDDFVSIEEYVTMLELDETNQETLVKFIGLKKPIVYYFKNPTYKASYKGFINDIIEDLVSKNPSSDRSLIAAQLIVAKGFIENGSSDPKRAMAFDNKLDLINGLISNIMPGVIDFKKTSSKGTTSIEFIYKEGPSKTVKVLQQPSQTVSEDMIKDNISKEEIDLRNKSALQNWNYVNDIMATASNLVKSKSNNYTKAEFAMLTAGLLGNMTTPLRASAPLKYIPIGVKELRLKDENGNRLWEYEHGIPAKALAVMLIDHHLNNNKIDLNKLRGSYSVGIIHKPMNNNFNRMFKDRMQIMYKVGDPPTMRWYNRFTQNGDLHIVKNIETNRLHGEKYVAISKKAIENRAKQELRISAKNATMMSIKVEPKGMSTFDFDETLIIGGDNFIIAKKGDKTIRITSAEWPTKGSELAADGYTFDFKDFVNVRGGTDGPLLQKMRNQIKKYGSGNVFVLTARMQEAAVPIHEWLKTKNIDIPLKNITGLGNSTGEAKAKWMLDKFSEGYNDMYFVDDAMPNVKAVKQVLDNLDIKSKVVQAKTMFSKQAGKSFNDMISRNSGIPKDKIFSDAQAKIRGRKSSRFTFFVPPSAEDFKGLLYNFLGKGKQGEKDMDFFKTNLLDPFSRAIRNINNTKQRISEEYKTLTKEIPTASKNLNNKVSGTDFTLNDAVRVYLWNSNDIDIPGISESEIQTLVEHVKSDDDLRAFAESVGNISRAKDGYIKPDENWVTGSIASDLHSQTNNINREEFLKDWQENVDVIFSSENLNKIEAIYGADFRDALENMLYRMRTGSNRAQGSDKVVNSFMDWINGSVGTVMFFNTRSAVLQTLSTFNFINWNDNNIFKAAAAFANQKQYWSDFVTLFNSDMLKQRRAGMAIDVNLAELSNAVAKSNAKDKYKAAVRYLLQIGFAPTQIADSFAIASGGATFYRNKIKKYLKQGMSKKEAEQKAFNEFQEIAEETQQSSRPDLISQQQAGTLGRLILAWQNTPMQYTRLTKKAISDLVNNRGDWKSHVSRILYYGAMQNVLFGSLQTGLAFLLFGADEDEEDTQRKLTRVANGALDTILRGTGVYGAMISTLKNTIMKYAEESKKPFGKKELSKVALEAVQLSPPIGSKLRKIMIAIYSYEYNKGVPEKMGITVDNPILDVVGNLVEATTNVPLARAVRKAQNLEEAVSSNHETWKRVALIMGWSKWDLNIKDEDIEKARKEIKIERKKQKEKEKKGRRCIHYKSDGRRCKNTAKVGDKKCYVHK